MNRKLVAAAAAAVALSILVPCPSQASPWGWTSPAAGLVEKVERWWGRLLHRPAPAAPEPGEKQGCGMDPNGGPACDPGGGGTSQTTEPAPAGSGTD